MRMFLVGVCGLVLVAGLAAVCAVAVKQERAETGTGNSEPSTADAPEQAGAPQAREERSAAKQVGREETEWKFTDLAGIEHLPFAEKRIRGVVVVFIMPDCPIANYFQPTLHELHDRFSAQGVPFFLVHSDSDVTREIASKHAEAYKISCPVVLDEKQVLARRLGARVTPQAFLLDSAGRVVYQGRINDLFADFGKRRREPTTHDLRNALEALLSGRPIEPAKTRAIGCYLAIDEEASESDATAQSQHGRP